MSASEGGWISSTIDFASTAHDNKRGKENNRSDEKFDRLKKDIKNLEQANTALKEELVEARLETTALRHTLVEPGEAELDTGTRDLGDEGKQGLLSSWSAQGVRGNLWRSARDGAGVCLHGEVEASIRLRATRNPDTRYRAAPVSSETYNNHDSHVNEERVEHLTVPIAHRTKGNSDYGNVGENPEVAPSPENFLRRLPSLDFKDEEEQRELIEALRDQISQLQLEKQTRMARTAVMGKDDNTGGAKLALGQSDGGAGNLSRKCSSDDDSGSGRDDCDGNPLTEYQPFSWFPQHTEDGAIGTGDANRQGNQSGGDTYSSGGSVDPAQHSSLLQARVSELSAELEAANRVIQALRQQAQQNQADSLELQRELVRLEGMRDSNNLLAAAVAAHSTYHNSNGGGGESLEQRSNCLNFDGVGWLRWLWVTFSRRGGRVEEVMGSSTADSAHEDVLMDASGELGEGNGSRSGRNWNGRGGRLSANDQELLLDRDSQTMAKQWPDNKAL